MIRVNFFEALLLRLALTMIRTSKRFRYARAKRWTKLVLSYVSKCIITYRLQSQPEAMCN